MILDEGRRRGAAGGLNHSNVLGEWKRIYIINPDESIMGEEWVEVGVPGFDDLFDKGVPRGVSTLVGGGPGSGKTIFCLQSLVYGASNGEKGLFMSFEESPNRLKDHMHDFGWDPDKLIDEGMLMIERYSPFDVSRSIEALLEKEERELLIDAPPVFIPEGFEPDRVAVDSLSAIAAPYVGVEERYRVYVEQLFRYFEGLDVTSFFITETEQDPEHPGRLTRTGVEEFLADGVILLYNIRKGDLRESAIEVLKMRGAKFQKKIVPMEIISGSGITVYPKQKVFGV